MRLALVVAAASLVSFASPALADPAQTWEAGYLVLDAADAAETISCLHRHTCTEGNPLFGKHPSTFKLIAGKLALGALQFTIFQKMHERDPHAALRYAQISFGLQGAVVGFNARIFFK